MKLKIVINETVRKLSAINQTFVDIVRGNLLYC
jgi:hypothetical protein